MIAERHTLAEFEDFIRAHPDENYEYITGEIIAVVADPYSSQVALLLGALLTLFIRAHGLGDVTGADGGYIVGGERYIPDVGFISKARQSGTASTLNGYNRLAPDLAVEVISLTDSERRLRIKVSNYLAAGTTVWVVDHTAKEIEIHAPGQGVVIKGLEDALEDPVLLPGFSAPVRDIFP